MNRRFWWRLVARNGPLFSYCSWMHAGLFPFSLWEEEYIRRAALDVKWAIEEEIYRQVITNHPFLDAVDSTHHP